MIIHQTQTKIVDDSVFLYARIETDQPVPNLPETLWFQFPRDYINYLDTTSNATLLSLVQLGMLLGEDITVHGAVSSRLAYGLTEYQNIYHAWLADSFHIINIKYEQLTENYTKPTATGVATAFSGGVDSFFTLWSQLPRNQEIALAHVTHGLYVHGFDIPLSDSEFYARLLEQYDKTFCSLGLTLIPVRTNARLFYQLRINWRYVFGAPLIAVGHALSPMFHRMYIPSGFNYDNIVANGSSPLHDHWVSSEQLEIVHHGVATSRINKFATIATWPLTYNCLHICSEPTRVGRNINCSKCNKCLSGITTLKIIKSLDLFSVFIPFKILKVITKWILVENMYVPYIIIIQREAFRRGQWGTGLMMTLPIFAGWIKTLTKKFLNKILPSSSVYDLKVNRYGLDKENYFRPDL